MKTIGSRIKQLRKDMNISQKELALKCGITEASLSRYENDLREPKAEIISKIATGLNTTTDYLLGKSEQYTNNSDDNISFEKQTLVENFINELIEDGIIKKADDIDDNIAQAIINIVKAEVDIKFRKRRD